MAVTHGVDRADGGANAATAIAASSSGTGVPVILGNLRDPNADRIVFWDDGAGTLEWLEVGTGLTLSGTSLSLTSAVVTDHGALTGLGDDDHGAVYGGLAQTEAVSGAWSFADIPSASITLAVVTSANITAAGIASAAMTVATITSAVITSAIVTTAILTGATITSGAITGTTITSAGITSANITNAGIASASITSAVVTTLVATGATITSGAITGTTITSAGITSANITNVGIASGVVTTLKVTTAYVPEQGAAPSTPVTGVWGLYFKSDGLYHVDDAGAEVGPLGVGGGGLSTSVSQTSHNLVVGDLVYNNGSAFVPAVASAAATAEVAGMVSAVPSGNAFTLSLGGEVTGLSAGMSAGIVYFLSPSTSGAMTATEPTTVGDISKPVFIATGTSTGILLQMRGAAVGSATSEVLNRTHGTATSGQVSIAISGSYGAEMVYVNGTLLEPATDYSYDGSSVVLSNAMTAGDAYYAQSWTVQSPVVYRDLENIVRNGDFRVRQRGDTFNSVSNAAYTHDGWFWSYATSGAINVTFENDRPTVAQAGYRYAGAHRMTVATAHDGTSTSYNALLQYIEGNLANDFVSRGGRCKFWVKGSEAFTFSFRFADSAGTTQYIEDFAVTTGWSEIDVTIPAHDTTAGGNWNYSNGLYGFLDFTVSVGANYQTTSTGVWTSGTTYVGSASCDDIMLSAGQWVQFTGIRLVPGTSDFDIPPRNDAEEWLLARRYLYSFSGKQRMQGLGSNTYAAIGGTVVSSSLIWSFNMHFPTLMRSTPTYADTSYTLSTSPGTSNAVGLYNLRSGAYVTVPGTFSATVGNPSPETATVAFSGSTFTGLVAGDAIQVVVGASAAIYMTAEL